jgi:hypothetical protein
MSAVLPHYKLGPANYQAAGLIFGGQFVEPNTLTAGTTDLTVKVSLGTSGTASQGSLSVLGVAGADANVITTQTGAANAYGEPLIDISVLGDYVPVWYGGVDIWVWYGGVALQGELLVVGASTGANCYGCVTGISGTPKNASATITPAYNNVVGRCTHPGGVAAAMLTQQIGGGQGGGGASAFFLGRARVF